MKLGTNPHERYVSMGCQRSYVKPSASSIETERKSPAQPALSAAPHATFTAMFAMRARRDDTRPGHTNDKRHTHTPTTQSTQKICGVRMKS